MARACMRAHRSRAHSRLAWLGLVPSRVRARLAWCLLARALRSADTHFRALRLFVLSVTLSFALCFRSRLLQGSRKQQDRGDPGGGV